jgi:hypothetical protein
MRRIFVDVQGSISVYTAILAVLGIGGAALAVDIGRAALLRTQMQDRADAGAMAAAVYLDFKPGARARADDVARNSIKQFSTQSGNGAELVVASVNFFSDYTANPPVVATGDDDARFVQVILESRRIDYFFQPVLAFMSGGGTSSQELNSYAVAASDPFICKVPPLMMCNPAEADPLHDLALPGNVGRQMVLKPPPSGGAWAPGNFGLLAPDGITDADVVAASIAAVEPPDCYTLDVTTAAGVKANKTADAMNARFDVNSYPDPAPNVIAYPQDDVIAADPTLYFGDGVWDDINYWDGKHGNSPVPLVLANASRYQTYLYELDVTFARNGKVTLVPPPVPLPAGYTVVDPPAPKIPKAADPAKDSNPWFDGIPSQTPASNGYRRRLVQVAVLDCVAENVKGSGTYPSKGSYVEMFVTEPASAPPDMRIFAEVAGTLTPSTAPDFHANVQLIE